jgi:hypothetical protein
MPPPAPPPAPPVPPARPPAVVWSLRLLRAHLVLAHLSLLAALAWTALRPQGLLGSVLHPEVLACVHLITLGCIATTCIGVFPVVLHLAMGSKLRADWRDWFLLVAVQLTATGVASHMALGTYGGVQWSALLLLVALLLQLPRFVLPVLRAKVPFASKLGNLLAWTNLLLAVCLGGALALQHSRTILPTDPLDAVFAHAHLALGGFAGTLIAAVGLRLLPMFLPALPPPSWLALCAVLGLGGGGFVAGLGALLPGWLDFGLWLLAGGAFAWLATVVAMLLQRRPPAPANLPPWLPAHLLLLCAVLSFAVALLLGTALHLHGLAASWWSTYGAILLLGGVGSLVLGIGQRLWPLAQRLHAGEGQAHRMPKPGLAWQTAALWTLGLLAMPIALRLGSPLLTHGAFGLLTFAVAADTWNLLRKR